MYARVLKGAIFAAICLGNYLVPKRRQLLLHSFPDVEDQLVALLRVLVHKNDGERRLVLLVSHKEEDARERFECLVPGFNTMVVVMRKTRLRAIWSYWRSDAVAFTHGLYGFGPVPQRQMIINLWHGMPTKAIWLKSTDSPVPACSYLLSTSEKFSSVLSDVSGFPPSKILSLGLPRNDLLFSRTDAVRKFSRRAREGVDRIVLFLPTFRKSNLGGTHSDGHETGSALLMTEEEQRTLQELLRDTRTRMLVKPHPMSVHYGQDLEVDENLWIISDRWLHRQGVTLYEALGQMEVLITDTSSVYVDFLALRRPTLFFFPDFEAYSRTRGFLLEPVESWLPGRLCTKVPQLLEELGDALRGTNTYAAERERLAAILNPQTAADVTVRVLALLAPTGKAGRD